MALRYQKNKPRVNVAGLDLVDAAEHAELERVRQANIAAQQWQQDKAFLEGFRRGDEIAWGSAAEFSEQQAAYRVQLQRKRRGKVGVVGERKIKKYAAWSAWSHARWVVLIVAILYGGWYAMQRDFFRSQDRQKVWVSSRDRGRMAQQTASPSAAGGASAPALAGVDHAAAGGVSGAVSPASAARDIGIPAGDVDERRGEVVQDYNRVMTSFYSSPLQRWKWRLQVFAYSLLVWWFCKYVLLRKKKPRQREDGAQVVIIKGDFAPE